MCRLCAKVNLYAFILIGLFLSTTSAVELHNWRLPFYRIAAEMDLFSSSPSGMFWDDLIGEAPFDSAMLPDPAAFGANHWTIEPSYAVGAGTPSPADRQPVYWQLEALNSIRYRNLTVRQTLNADRRYNDDPLYPAHTDRFARGRIEEAYLQYSWRYGFIRFGRTVRNWGPFIDRSLILSSNPYSYDAVEWQVHSSFFEFRHLFTAFVSNGHFIDSTDNRPGRFFAAHALNVMFGKWATLGVTESMVFRRPNGFPDFQYINPFSVYSVLDLNQEGNGNLMLGFQWKVRPLVENISLKGQLLLDDIQVDNNVEGDKEPAHWGIDAGIFWRDGLPLQMHHLLKAGYRRCSEWAYTVPDNNTDNGEGYTYLSKGLGLPGNDGDNLYAGFSLVGRNFWAAAATAEYCRNGQNTVTGRWHDSDSGNITGLPFDYQGKRFPSGIVEKTVSLSLEGNGYFRDYADVRISFTNRWIRNKNHVASSSFVYDPVFTAEIGIHFSGFFIRLPK